MASNPSCDRLKVVEAIACRLTMLRQVLPIKLLVLCDALSAGDGNGSKETRLVVIYDNPKKDDADQDFKDALELSGLEPRLYSLDEYAVNKREIDAIVAKGMVLYQEGGVDRRRRMGRTWKRGLRWMGNGLVGAGLAILLSTGGYYAYSYYALSQIEQGVDGSLAQYGAGSSLEEAQSVSPMLASFLAGSPDSATVLGPETTASGDEVSREESTSNPSGVYTATRMIIPSIEVDSKIIETGIVFEDGEWQWERPKNAVGHLVGTGNPGEPGNIVTSGHISSPQRGEGQVFKRLPDIKLGDVVILYTPVRAFAYQVVAKKVVLPTEVSALNPTPDETLTLITCVPDFIYSHRLIVTAKRIGQSL